MTTLTERIDNRLGRVEIKWSRKRRASPQKEVTERQQSASAKQGV